MTRLGIKILLFIFVNTCIYCAVVSIPAMRHSFTNGNTESNLLPMPIGGQYDLLIMGTSHGKIFSRNGNGERVEEILSKKVYTIAKGGGHGGVFPEFLFLSRFYDNDNHAQKILYLVDPWAFYSRQWNEGNYFLEDEPVDPGFLVKAIREGVDRSVVLNYLQSKLTRRWLSLSPATQEPKTDHLSFIDGKQVMQDKRDSYLDGLNRDTFLRYSEFLERTVLLAEDQNSEVILAYPTTLLGRTPGKGEVDEILRTIQKRHPNVKIYDFSTTITDPQYFYDNNHLNSAGVELFTKIHLLPVLF